MTNLLLYKEKIKINLLLFSQNKKQKTEKREKGSDKTGALLIFRESRQFVKQHLVEVKKKLIFHYINSNIL
jgi:hypothetical protein